MNGSHLISCGRSVCDIGQATAHRKFPMASSMKIDFVLKTVFTTRKRSNFRLGKEKKLERTHSVESASTRRQTQQAVSTGNGPTTRSFSVEIKRNIYCKWHFSLGVFIIEGGEQTQHMNTKNGSSQTTRKLLVNLLLHSCTKVPTLSYRDPQIASYLVLRRAQSLKPQI